MFYTDAIAIATSHVLDWDLPDELLLRSLPASTVQEFRGSSAAVWSLSVSGRKRASAGA